MDARLRVIYSRLSARERQILIAIGRGQTNNEIAHELGLTHETVKTYANRLRAKLGFRGTRVGAKRRDEYAHWLQRFGLIEEHDHGLDANQRSA